MHMFRTNPGPILINNQVIESVDNYKLLGVHIDKNLTWNIHTEKIINKSKSVLYFLNKKSDLLRCLW